jgi:PAS domain S-box-containing protein
MTAEAPHGFIERARKLVSNIIGAAKGCKMAGPRQAEDAGLRLAAIVEGSDDAIISATLDGIVTTWNKGAENVYGYSAAEMMGKPIFQLVPNDSHGEIFDVLGKIGRNERMVHYETTRIRKGGRKISVSVSASPISNSKGQIIGLSSIARDITAQKKSEQLLRESEERYRFLFKDSQTAMLLIDPETGRIMGANPKASSFYGYPREELLKLRITDINILSAEQVNAEMQCARTEQRTYFRFQHRLANGELRDVEVYSGPIKIDGKQLLCSMIHDETERKKAEETVRESESRLDLALRSSQMGVWRLDLVENRRVFDDQVCRVLGIDPAGFSGTDGEFFNAVHPEDHEKIRAALANAINNNAPYESDYRAIWPDGSIHYITTRGSLFHDDEGRPVRLNGLIWDITERKLMEEERERLVLQLQEALAKVRTLSGLLPICAYCKKIRNDEGYWEQIEAYIHEHSEAQFTHGVCPDCYKKLQAELGKLRKSDRIEKIA